jgi:TPR repeat protein
MYADGQGVQQDYVQALMWFTLAAKAGDRDAIQSGDTASRLMPPSQVEEAKRLAAEWRPGGGG